MSENKNIVNPSILSGFMELLPEDQIVFNKMKDTIRKTYESYGFIPLDTPVIEKSEVLLAKSGGDTEKQIYRFTKGENDLALRFDLTVPLARFVAQHYGELTFPFRRYHIGKAYRGERPQKGRFREFYQCDIDIVGNGSLSIINDAEIVSVIYSTFKNLGFEDFTIMINNRKLLNGLFRSLGTTNATEVMRTVDKIDKIGPDEVKKELIELGMDENAVEKLLAIIAMKGAPDSIIPELRKMGIDNDEFKTGVDELEKISECISSLGVDPKKFELNLKIARGLDYYTGTVYETFLNDYPQLGSVCSGGRYDELASNYTKQSLPGVGISIGLSRLFYQLREIGLVGKTGHATTTDLLFIPIGDTLNYTLSAAAIARSEGINTEVYMNEGKLGKKFTYANNLGIPFVAAVGETEVQEGTLTVKDMRTGEQETVKKESLAEYINAKK